MKQFLRRKRKNYQDILRVENRKTTRLLQKVSLPSSGKLCPLSREEGEGGPGPFAGHSLQRHVEEFESKVRF